MRRRGVEDSLHSDQSLQEPLTATSQTSTVNCEEPTGNTELTAGCLQDSLSVLSIEVNLHSLIQQVLVQTGELRGES